MHEGGRVVVCVAAIAFVGVTGATGLLVAPPPPAGSDRRGTQPREQRPHRLRGHAGPLGRRAGHAARQAGHAERVASPAQEGVNVSK